MVRQAEHSAPARFALRASRRLPTEKEAAVFMSDTTIQTLKTMLANLDDAKKY